MDSAPISIVDDDHDHREFLQYAWKELELLYTLVFLDDGEEALQYLGNKTIIPFLILCDVNMPKMDGFELKKKILGNTGLNYKSIPFVFWPSQASAAQIQKAYDLGGNGFFVKENNFKDKKQSLIEIVQYWQKSKTPSQNS